MYWVPLNRWACTSLVSYLKNCFGKALSKFLAVSQIFEVSTHFRHHILLSLITPAIPIIGHKKLSTRLHQPQRFIQKPVKHLRWNDFRENSQRLKAVTYFRKIVPSSMFDRFLNMPVPAAPPIPGNKAEI